MRTMRVLMSHPRKLAREMKKIIMEKAVKAGKTPVSMKMAVRIQQKKSLRKT
jgi:hypothetical protein